MPLAKLSSSWPHAPGGRETDSNTGVLSAEDEDSGRIWHIVPLSVHPDIEPVKYGSPL